MASNNFKWLLKMAWRDSRRSRGRLLLFISSIILGIAALVAINSFSENLQKDIESEARTLLGADLSISSNLPAPDSLRQLFDSIGGEQARSRYLVSMALFPRTGDTRLSEIRALEGDYPFYGKISTTPETAYLSFREGPRVLVDRTLMLQFALQLGDTVRVGQQAFTIEGTLNAAPGRAGISSSFAPAIYIPMQYLEATELIQPGSRVFYQQYFKLAESVDIPELVKTIKPRLQAASHGYETVEGRKEDLSEAFSDMNTFLNLVGFIALLLGCIGVASAVHIYIKDKLNTVAVLRCIGASGRQAFLIFLLQILMLSIIGSVVGALLGSGLQLLLPAVLKDFLPLQNVSADVSLTAVTQGVITGVFITLLFALLPLLSIRKISPLRSLRASMDNEGGKPDRLRWLVYLLIFFFVAGFSFFQTGGGLQAISFPISLAIALLLLAGVARLLTWAVRKFFPTQWSYVWRQSIANLYRPNNQTLILMVTIGLGTTLISTLFFVQGLLLNQVELSGSGDQPNIILFDIQPSQKQAVAELTKKHDLPVLQQVPIVTMRLDNIDGMTKVQRLKDTTSNVRRWVYNREYRVTYRDTLIETESIKEGQWHMDKANRGDTIFVSLDENIAEDMNAEVGTKLTFNVQGALIETVVGSIREIKWDRVQTNFFVVFPSGILENAPQFNVIVSRVNSIEQSAAYQRELVRAFPNVSVIDLGQILKSVDEILSKVSFVIRFMALFSVLTGLLVLISSVVLSKFQRVRESVLLRTIGANRKQILWINALEYFFLGSLATLTGILLSVIGSWLLAYFSFNIPFQPDLWPPFVVLLSITSLTVLIGLFNSRSVVNRPPLEVLRAEI
ncbi:MAG: FtsX-like permease family protein [Bacteroidota bacterium]